MTMKKFFPRTWTGLKVSKRIFWLLLSIDLSAFTIIGIIWAIGDVPIIPRLIPFMFGLSLLLLVILVFVYAPYRGAVKEIEDTIELWQKVVAEVRRVDRGNLLGYENELREAKKTIEALQQENAKLKGGQHGTP